MKKGSKHGQIGLCMVIGMIMLGSNPAFTQQDRDIVKSSTSHYFEKSNAEITPLKVGDKVPNITFEKILYYPHSKANLSDFKSKLIILDFWSSYCGACIQLFPHMDSLKKEFGSNLQIILVNGKSQLSGDDDKRITGIIERVKQRTGIDIQLPVVYDCDILDKYFVYNAIPHEVWINDSGEVIAITSSTEVNKNNIKSILEGKKISLRSKTVIDFDRHIPLFVNGNGGCADDFMFRSILTGCKEGTIAGTGQRHNEKNQITGFYMYNKPLSTLLGFAGYNLSFRKNLLFVEVSKSFKIDPPDDETKYNYLYCYDLTVPPGTYTDLQKYIRQDIERYFHITVKSEKRKLDCIVLKGLSNPSHFVWAKGDGRAESDLENTTAHKYVKNFSISNLVMALNNYSSIPLINEIENPGRIDMELPFDLTDKVALISALKKAGFIVNEELREMDVTVITDK
jgi:thiol-disulfide isomerase/thioredoxin